ncbi:MAG: efflux RND transporter periplasmic adaptor subunit, partial [Pseudomonadales bacterium]|nr:efflux RND transporter periplasmic adaptor subunit [Pseudomonadales bacterium]
VIVLTAIVTAILVSMKKPPKDRPKEEQVPVVKVDPVITRDLQLKVRSYGVVTPRYETQLVAQVSGTIQKLSEQFVKGGFVRAGEVLAEIDARDYEAVLIEAQASLKSAQAALEQERAQVIVARKEWQGTQGEPTALSLRKPQLAQEEARVKAAMAQVTRATNDLERTQVRAPYDGLIVSRLVGMGAYVNPGTSLGMVYSVDTAEVRLPIAQNQYQFLEGNGLGAEVVLKADVAGSEASWDARIIRSEGVVDRDSRMTYLVAQVSRPYEQNPPLPFGLYATAALSGKHLKDVAVLPQHILVDGKLPLLDLQQRLNFKPVEVIRVEGTHAVVRGDFGEQDRFISSALHYPVQGMQLKVAAGTENPPIAKRLSQKPDAEPNPPVPDASTPHAKGDAG